MTLAVVLVLVAGGAYLAVRVVGARRVSEDHPRRGASASVRDTESRRET